MEPLNLPELNVEHSHLQETISNCSICRNSSIRRNTKCNHKMESRQVNKFSTKPKNTSSRIVYNYPYSSSSSSASSKSLIGKKRKKSITMHPSTKGCDDDETTDSEFNTCDMFPITEKHYRHILDGVECLHRPKNSSSLAKSKPKLPKEDPLKVTKRANMDSSQSTSASKQSNPSNAHACEKKVRKKCSCRNKNKLKAEEEESESLLSEKTFTKFINSLHSYVKKSKKSNNHKFQKIVLDSDSSLSLSEREEKHVKRKKSNREKEGDAKKHQHHH